MQQSYERLIRSSHYYLLLLKNIFVHAMQIYALRSIVDPRIFQFTNCDAIFFVQNLLLFIQNFSNAQNISFLSKMSREWVTYESRAIYPIRTQSHIYMLQPILMLYFLRSIFLCSELHFRSEFFLDWSSKHLENCQIFSDRNIWLQIFLIRS